MAVDYRKLCEIAYTARENSYSPYSHFRVGAALATSDGRIFTGVNVENASYPVGICAERSALSSALSAGAKEFCAIAVCGDSPYCMPCGMCRQSLAEFCAGEFEVLCVGETAEVFKLYTLGELLPHTFDSVSAKVVPERV